MPMYANFAINALLKKQHQLSMVNFNILRHLVILLRLKWIAISKSKWCPMNNAYAKGAPKVRLRQFYQMEETGDRVLTYSNWTNWRMNEWMGYKYLDNQNYKMLTTFFLLFIFNIPYAISRRGRGAHEPRPCTAVYPGNFIALV